MDSNVIKVDTVNDYQELAVQRMERQDYIGALSLLFTSLKFSYNFSTIALIAEIYSLMELYELSNEYWYQYMHYAPQKKHGRAYEGLAINYFYLDDYFITGHYFKNKIELDGPMENKEVQDSILKTFEEETDIKNSFYMAYPYEKADYSYYISHAKKAIARGDMQFAYSIYDSIPKESFKKEQYEEFISMSLMLGDADNAIELCKESLEKYGENVSDYSYLSSAYFEKGDQSKASYYHNLAKNASKETVDDSFNLIVSSINQKDHFSIIQCAKIILQENPNEYVYRYYLALAYFNSNRYEDAKVELYNVQKILKDNFFIEYYLRITKKLLNNEKVTKNALNANYSFSFNSKLKKEFADNLDYAFNNCHKQTKFKNIDLEEILQYGLNSNDVDCTKKALFIICTIYPKDVMKYFQKYLISQDIEDHIKVVFIYTIVLFGIKDSFSVLINKSFLTIQAKKVLSEDDFEDKIYTCAYAMCLAKSLYLGINEPEKIAFKSNDIYKNYKFFIDIDKLDFEEVAGLIFYRCKFENYKDIKEIAKIFNVNYKRLAHYIDIYFGDLDD